MLAYCFRGEQSIKITIRPEKKQNLKKQWVCFFELSGRRSNYIRCKSMFTREGLVYGTSETTPVSQWHWNKQTNKKIIVSFYYLNFSLKNVNKQTWRLRNKYILLFLENRKWERSNSACLKTEPHQRHTVRLYELPVISAVGVCGDGCVWDWAAA